MRDRAGFCLLLVWATSAPVLYGSVPEAEVSWPYSVFLALGIATLLISSPLLQRRDRHAASSARLLLLLGLLALLALLQLVPLPRAL
ncbi:MAG: hypothetical protein ACYS99_23105, partial [Planctomycetota bacterium]